MRIAADQHQFRGGTGEPLVLLHGATSSWKCWRDVIPLLTGTFDVFAPNLSGHGGRPRPSRPHSIIDLADEVEAQLNAAGIDTAHVVGNSLGGWLAVELARRGRARSVVALSPAGGWHPGEKRVIKHFYSMRRWARLARFVPAFALRSARLRRYALRAACEHGERLTARQALASARSARACVLDDFSGLGDGLEPGRYVRLTAHVLIAWSEFDRIIPAADYTDRWRQEVPRASWMTLADVGHCPMYDDPQLVARTVLEWMAATAEPAATPDVASS
jgi:pimeloyl-ACP methyl ester carboxylesterase